MKKYYVLLTILLMTMSLFAQPANDDCSNPEAINVTTNATTVPFDINTATLNNQTICTTTADFADVWYEFTMPFNGNVYVDGFLPWNNFALYDTCNVAESACGISNKLFTNLTSGSIYILRVYRTSAQSSNTAYQSFTIKAFEAALNVDCASSETIPVTTDESTVNFNIGGASVNNEVGCTGTIDDYVDIWYDFTMPVNGNLFVDGTIGWNNFALYDTCSGAQIQCGTNNQLFTELSLGTNYKLRVFRIENDADNTYTSFTIKAFEEAVNDNCASAETITVTTDESTVNFNIGGASIYNEMGCTGTTDDYVDIWYDFNMPINGNLYVDGTIGWNNFALYDSCGGTQIQCGNGSPLFTGLTSGTNYKLRLFRTRANADNTYTSFTTKVFETSTNDACASAETITVSTDISTINFNIGGASINNEVGCTGITDDYADIWYNFTMPVNGNIYVDGTIGWNNFALYDECSGTEIQCGSGNELITGLSATTNYKLRVFRTLANADNTYLSFTIQAFEIINNDDCSTAENITVTDVPMTVNFGIAGATINNEIGCSGTTAEDYADVWYEFTMPTDGFISIDGTIAWNNFALYDACQGNEVACFNNSGDIGGLTNGNIYKLRIFRTLSNADNQQYKSFSIYSSTTLGLNTINQPTMNIYPNPSSDYIAIDYPLDIEKVEFYTLLGKMVMQEKNPEIMDVSKLSEGVYIMKIFTQKGFVSKRMIKK